MIQSRPMLPDSIVPCESCLGAHLTQLCVLKKIQQGHIFHHRSGAFAISKPPFLGCGVEISMEDQPGTLLPGLEGNLLQRPSQSLSPGSVRPYRGGVDTDQDDGSVGFWGMNSVQEQLSSMGVSS